MPCPQRVVVVGEHAESIGPEHALTLAEDLCERPRVPLDRFVAPIRDGKVLLHRRVARGVVIRRLGNPDDLMPAEVEVGELGVAQIVEVRWVREDQVHGLVRDQ